ncbi:type III secretion system chaperone [Candidatus Sodalis endolongispinus]|uniref:Type III secretion system chaperone n=1 Tax=Candidatus Sodalis endolongispinus TaxID=2812662 RepID=A0ABS5YE45_9GAMM|nr:type III secretion system chaperone [Candidatus Sodalis endolongispinus]MBT9433276.1 type III secretion system chaperone [Candidatus Sodalis endolongispinus]
MTFEQLLHVLSVETHLNLDEAIDSGGCTLEFDKNIRVTLEHHNGCVYIFSPVMAITGELSGDFFASLLQVQLFGIATHRCWFGYDVGGQRIILFFLMDLAYNSAQSALENIENLIDQSHYWLKNLPDIACHLGVHGAPRSTNHFAVR